MVLQSMTWINFPAHSHLPHIDTWEDNKGKVYLTNWRMFCLGSAKKEGPSLAEKKNVSPWWDRELSLPAGPNSISFCIEISPN